MWLDLEKNSDKITAKRRVSTGWKAPSRRATKIVKALYGYGEDQRGSKKLSIRQSGTRSIKTGAGQRVPFNLYM
jgi:hypothetical protein